MYQFSREDDAIEGARVLAAQTACPVLVMCRTENGRAVWTIGLRTMPAVRQAGTHAGTVHRSGRVELGQCIRRNWLQRALKNPCLCE